MKCWYLPGAFLYPKGNNKFIIRTDNTQVKWWITRKIQDSVTTKEIRRLVLNIQNFTFTIEVISTNKNVIADYISRQTKLEIQQIKEVKNDKIIALE